MSAPPTLRHAVLRLLCEEGPMTRPELAEILQVGVKTVEGCIRQTLKTCPDALHIGSWRRNTGPGAHGRISPVYHPGPGQDKPRPPPLSRAEVNRRYEAAHRAARRINRLARTDRHRVPGWLQGLAPITHLRKGTTR